MRSTVIAATMRLQVVPAEVLFSIDLRHPDNSIVDEMDRKIRHLVEAECGPCTVEIKQIAHAPSLAFSTEIRSLIGAAASAEKIPSKEIYSAAGHDARQLHYVCPTGMISYPAAAAFRIIRPSGRNRNISLPARRCSQMCFGSSRAGHSSFCLKRTS